MIGGSTSAVPSNDCWNRIGVAGDRSCPELVRHIHCRNCPVFAATALTFFDRPAPAGYLADWDRLLATRDAPDEGTAGVSLLIFRLHDEFLALNTKTVVEVTGSRPVHRIPHRTNPMIAGLTNLRGQLHLCVSLHGLLGVDPSATQRVDRPRMVVIQAGGAAWVFMAEAVLGVHRVPNAELRNVPSTLANPAVSFSQAVFDWDGESVGYLDDDRVFSGLRSLAS